ncbi:bcl-2-like protein 10 [Ochotona curzoniae]|uniref:bcl-2-like protein 10 n=1 Tax=Ochotona curzoniae TaxID=130825 RepID=UPI001B348AA9|nr:bcl-2-like protein 10 [Ochotona curzoniae]
MADDLKERTARLLTDYLECCAREPGTPEPQPSTPEAAVLRSAAAQLQRIHRPFFSAYRGYPGNRVELMMRVVEAVLPDGHDLSWGRVVTLVTFAGTLLERGPHLTTTRWQRRNEIARDCQRLVTLLCTRLTGQYRAWLQAQGGWDGFCAFFRTPLPLTFWRRVLVHAFLSCLLATALLYFWTRVLHHA